MKQGDLIFVYGTLRRGETADLSENPQVKYVGPDKINGKIYTLGWFPGVKLFEGVMGFDPEMPTIEGDLFEIADGEVCDLLDRYEGYNPLAPDDGLYNRCQVETGGSRYAWVYTYNGTVSEDARLTDGSWSYKPEQFEAATVTIAATLGGGAGAI